MASESEDNDEYYSDGAYDEGDQTKNTTRQTIKKTPQHTTKSTRQEPRKLAARFQNPPTSPTMSTNKSPQKSKGSPGRNSNVPERSPSGVGRGRGRGRGKILKQASISSFKGSNSGSSDDPVNKPAVLTYNQKLPDQSDATREIEDATEGNETSAEVEVSGFEPTMESDILTMYFESPKKSGGGDIKSCVIKRSTNTAVIIFTEQAACERVLKKSHTLGGRKLEVRLKVPEESPTAINVSGFDASIEKDILTMYFENPKKSGGGEIESCDIDKSANAATITFTDQSVCERVLKRSHKLGKCTLTVVAHTTADGSNTTMSEAIEVSGFDPSIGKDILTMYFENPNKSGGGEIQSCDIDQSTGTATIVFTDPLSCENVLQREHKLGRHTLNVVPKNLYEKENKQSPTAIEISGFDQSIDKEILTMYFENPEKSDGGEIESCEIDQTKNTASIVFRDETVYTRVLQRGHKLGRHTLTVRSKEPEEKKPEQSPKVIEVSGFDPSIGKDILTMYFEDPKKSGGGEIQSCDVNQSTSTASILFKDAEVCEQVLNKSHQLGGRKLKVAVKEPEGQSINVIEISGFDPSIGKDILIMYFENPRNSGGGEIKSCDIDQSTGTATITFTDSKVCERVVQQDHNLGGRTLIVGMKKPAQPTPSVIEVSGFDPSMTKDILTMYFENPKISGGGEIRSCDIDKATKTATITFADNEVCECVLQRSHCLGGQTLKVVRKSLVQQTPSLIAVSGFDSSMKKDILTMYFENPRTSGGGKIQSCKINQSTNTAVITFADRTVANRVLQRKHVIGNFELTVAAKSQDEPDNDESEEEEEDVPMRAIQVSGFKSSTTRESLQLYFESHKSGGDEVSSVDLDNTKKIAIVLFVNPSVVDTVLQKRHKLEGSPLQVQEVKPRPKDKCKFVLKGIPETTSVEMLKLFVENKTGIREEPHIYFGENPDTVLVHVEHGMKDVKTFLPKLSEAKLANNTIIAEEIEVTDGIVIQGFPPETSKEMLELYFTNERKSGGGNVREIRLHSEENCAVLHFEDESVVSSVIQKKHKLGKNDLTVAPYYECLGMTVSTEGPIPRIPEPVVSIANPHLMEHIMKVERKTLEQEMKSVSSEVIWPHKGNKEEVLLKPCETDSSTTTVWRQWQKASPASLTKFCNQFESVPIPISKTIWSDFSDKIPELQTESVSFVERPDQSKVILIGRRQHVDSVKETVLRVTKEMQEKADRDAQTIEKRKRLDPLRIKLFSICRMADQLQQTYPDVQISILHDSDEILFKGITAEISLAQVLMYETLQAIQKRTFESQRNPSVYQYIKKYLDKINNKLQSQGINAIADAEETKITISGNSTHDLDQAWKLVDEDLVSESMNIDQENVLEVLQSNKGSKKIERINKTKEVIVTLEATKKRLLITGFLEDVKKIKSDIATFLEGNVTIKRVVSLPAAHMNFAIGFCSAIFESLQNQFKSVSIQPQSESSDAGFLVTGNRKDTADVISKLEDLKTTIIQRPQSFSKAGIQDLVQSGKTTSRLTDIGRECKCVIEVQKSPSSLEDSGAMSSTPTATLCYYTTIEGRRLKVLKGDLTTEPVDAIVNAANTKLDHIGGLAKAIVNAGGDIIQQESHKLLKRKGQELDTSEAVCTGPGSLPCRHIIHVAGPMYNQSPSSTDAENLLFDAATNALREAHRLTLSSVAVPAISAGMYGFPSKVCAKVIIEATDAFLKTEPNTSLTDIRFINNTVEHSLAFQEALQSYFGDAVVIGSTLEKKIDDSDKWAIGMVEVPDYSSMKEDLPHSRQSPVSHPDTVVTSLRFQKVSSDTIKTKEGMKVILKKGSIADDSADVIVNTTSPEMNLKMGNVSKALLSAGGIILQAECDLQLMQGGTKQPVRQGSFIETGPGKLQCQKVFHSTCPQYAGSESVQTLHSLITKLLTKADSYGMTSIAIPAIGTGNLRFPGALTAHEMFEAVAEFSKTKPKSSLRDVHFWVYDKDLPTIQAFEAEMEKRVAAPDTVDTGAVPSISVSKMKRSRIGKKSSRAAYSPVSGVQDTSSLLMPSGRKLKKPAGAVALPIGAATSIPDVSHSRSSSNGSQDSRFGPLTIDVEQGDITQDSAEAIVNTVGRDLKLNGPISTAILKAGGRKIADECDQIRGGTSPIPCINKTTAGNLPSTYIIHGFLQHPDMVKKLTRDILEFAEKEQIQSIAFPALGTGNIGGNPQSVASAMFAAIQEFASNENPKALKSVKLKIFQIEMVPLFKQALGNVQDVSVKKSEGFMQWGKRIVKDTYFKLTGTTGPELEKEGIKFEESKPTLKESATFLIIGNDEKNLDKAVLKLRDYIEDELIEDVFEVLDQEEIISENVMKNIRPLGSKHQVSIRTDAKKRNSVILEGHKDHVNRTKIEITKTIAAIRKEEIRKKEDELINSKVMWRYQADQGLWETYVDEANAMIERAYRKNKDGFIELPLDSGKVKIDFKTMVEIDLSGKGKDDIKVHRADKEAEGRSVTPSNWIPMDASENVKVVALTQGSEEYTKVENVFKTGYQPSSIVKIERIQNKELYKQYMARKEKINNRRGADSEKTVYHGTSKDTVDKINKDGFNRSYSGKNAVMYGCGSYFARDVSYSARTTYSPPDSQTGHKHIYMCKVLVGDFFKGTPELIAPQKTDSQQIFDCTVDDEQDPGIFVIFHDAQAYPEYLITFTR